MSVAEDIMSSAQALLDEFGKTITFNSMGAGTYDPSTSTVALSVNGTYTIQAVVEPAPGAGRSGLIAQNSRKITIIASSLPVAPAVKDKIGVNGINYVIANIDSYFIDETPVVYVVAAERG